MKTKFHLLIVCGLIALFSCNHTHTSPYDAELVHADSLTYSNKKAMLEILQSIDASRLKGNANRAYYALLLSEAQYRNGVEVKNDSLINVAVSYYSKSDKQELAVRSLIYASCIYKELGDLELSTSTIQKADERANEVTDKRLLYMLYYHWGMIMQEEKPFDKSIEYFSKAKQYAEELNNTVFVIHALREIGFSHMLNFEYKAGESCIKKALLLAEKLHNNELSTQLNLYLARIAETKGAYEEALKYANEAYRNMLSSNLNLTKQIYPMKGYIFLSLNELDSAKVYIQKTPGTSLYDKAVHQEQLSQLSEKEGNLKAALQHSRNYAELVDSIREFETDKKVMRLQQLYDYSKIEAERDGLKIASQRQQIYILVLALAIVIAVGVSYIMISSIRRRYRERQLALERIDHDTKRQLSDKIKELRQLEEKAAAQMQTNATEKESLHKEILGLRQQLIGHQEIVKKIEDWKRLSSAQKLRNKTPLSDGDSAELVKAVDLCYPGFSDRLHQRHPGLENADIVMCCLLKLGVTNSDLSLLFNISDNTLRKRKHRLKKEKMGIDDKQFKTLEDYLNSPLFSPEATE